MNNPRDIHELSIAERTADDAATKNAREQLARLSRSHELDWLRQAFVTGEGMVARMLAKHRALQARVLEWDETKQRRLTVYDAQLLNVCRVCHGPYSAPFMLDFGREFAHEACLRREEP